MIYWVNCNDFMPDVSWDRKLRESDDFEDKQFLVCYHHGDDVAFFARCTLRDGKFDIEESCHSSENCPDEYQEKYWNEGIFVTHWARIDYPEDIGYENIFD